jgi:hypothetical protein
MTANVKIEAHSKTRFLRRRRFSGEASLPTRPRWVAVLILKHSPKLSPNTRNRGRSNMMGPRGNQYEISILLGCTQYAIPLTV